jgi:hypothetical protein
MMQYYWQDGWHGSSKFGAWLQAQNKCSLALMERWQTLRRGSKQSSYEKVCMALSIGLKVHARGLMDTPTTWIKESKTLQLDSRAVLHYQATTTLKKAEPFYITRRP